MKFYIVRNMKTAWIERRKDWSFIAMMLGIFFTFLAHVAASANISLLMKNYEDK